MGGAPPANSLSGVASDDCVGGSEHHPRPSIIEPGGGMAGADAAGNGIPPGLNRIRTRPLPSTSELPLGPPPRADRRRGGSANNSCLSLLLSCFFFFSHIFDSFIPSSCGGDMLFTAGFLVVSSRDPSLAFVILFCHFGRILQREALRSLAHFPFR